MYGYVLDKLQASSGVLTAPGRPLYTWYPKKMAAGDPVETTSALTTLLPTTGTRYPTFWTSHQIHSCTVFSKIDLVEGWTAITQDSDYHTLRTV